MKNYLSSMRFAFWVLISLIAWLILGAFLTSGDTFYSDLKEMSYVLVIDWVLEKSSSSPLLLLWLVGVCIIGTLLAVSFAFCSWNNLNKAMRNKKGFASTLLFAIHVLFIAILGMHLATMVFGFKHSNVELMVGDTYEFESGYSITLNKVTYIDDIEVLKMPYKKMREHQTADNFHYKKNRAGLTLSYNGNELKTGEVRMLSPFRYENIRATLSFFYLPKGSESDVPGVNLVIMKNSLVWLFFLLYALGISSVLLFLLITWRKN